MGSYARTVGYPGQKREEGSLQLPQEWYVSTTNLCGCTRNNRRVSGLVCPYGDKCCWVSNSVTLLVVRILQQMWLIILSHLHRVISAQAGHAASISARESVGSKAVSLVHPTIYGVHTERPPYRWNASGCSSHHFSRPRSGILRIKPRYTLAGD